MYRIWRFFYLKFRKFYNKIYDVYRYRHVYLNALESYGWHEFKRSLFVRMLLCFLLYFFFYHIIFYGICYFADFSFPFIWALIDFFTEKFGILGWNLYHTKPNTSEYYKCLIWRKIILFVANILIFFQNASTVLLHYFLIIYTHPIFFWIGLILMFYFFSEKNKTLRLMFYLIYVIQPFRV